MASGVVRAAIAKIPDLPECKVDTSRTRSVKLAAYDLLQSISRNDQFDTFAEKLLDLLTSNIRSVISSSQSRSTAVVREKLWKSYHQLRSSTLPAMWRRFLISIGSGYASDPLMPQLVNETLYEELLKQEFPVQQTTPITSTSARSFTKDESNIIRYACGYVAMKLHQRFSKLHGEKPAVFVECLEKMAMDGPDTSLLDYTKEWVKKVNRGGLFEVSDEVYRLFVAIEAALCERLTDRLQKSAAAIEPVSTDKSSMIGAVVHDPDVEFYWTFLSVDVQDEETSYELLNHIVSLWLTIRGFSLSSQWMEEYKSQMHVMSSKTKSLRKELKKVAPPAVHED